MQPAHHTGGARILDLGVIGNSEIGRTAAKEDEVIMKLIPPQMKSEEEVGQEAQSDQEHILQSDMADEVNTVEDAAEEDIQQVLDEQYEQSKEETLAILSGAAEGFIQVLSDAITRISENDFVTPALALTGFLIGGAEMVDGIARSGRGSQVVGKRKPGRPAKVRRTVTTKDGSAPKRGRGRPKGSKNKSTLERAAAERVAAKQQRAAKKPVEKVPAKRAGKRGTAPKSAGKKSARVSARGKGKASKAKAGKKR